MHTHTQKTTFTMTWWYVKVFYHYVLTFSWQFLPRKISFCLMGQCVDFAISTFIFLPLLYHITCFYDLGGGWMWGCAVACGSWKRVSDLLVLEWQAVLSHSVGFWEKLRSSSGPASSYPGTFSASPISLLKAFAQFSTGNTPSSCSWGSTIMLPLHPFLI